MFNHIIIIFQSDSASDDDFNVVGSSLLTILDDYAFNYNTIEGDIHFLLENIGNSYNIIIFTGHLYQHTALQTRQLTMTTDNVGHEDLIMTIDSSEFPSFSQPRMSIEIPPDLDKIFTNMSGIKSNGVRLVSFLYANVIGLFPSSLPGENG